MAMSFMESMQDKAARLIPSSFTDAVEDATSDVQLEPNVDRMLQIADYANSKEESIVDIVRAVRRRMDHKSAKVRLFNVVLLNTLFKNCGEVVHLEIQATKGLLADLVALAGINPTSTLERDAKVAGAQLILNLSFWFEKNEKLQGLAQLANYARTQKVSFEGLEPSKDTVIQKTVRPLFGGAEAQARSPQPSRGQRPRRRPQAAAQQQANQGAAGPHGIGRGLVVDAIPIVEPDENAIEGMMEGITLLAECLNNAEESKEHVMGNEMIANVAGQVRRDYRNLEMMVESGAELKSLEVLLSIVDSQTAILERLRQLVLRDKGEIEQVQQHEQVVLPAPGSPPSMHAPPQQQQQQPQQNHDGGHQKPPTMDDLFGASPATHSPPQRGAPQTQPLLHQQPEPRQEQHRHAPPPQHAPPPSYTPPVEHQPPPPGYSEAPVPAPAPAPSPGAPVLHQPPVPAPTTQQRSAADVDEVARPVEHHSPPQQQQQQQRPASSAFSAPSQDMDHAKPTPSEFKKDDGELPAQTGSLNGPEGTTTTTNTTAGDDFDDFLNARLNN